MDMKIAFADVKDQIKRIYSRRESGGGFGSNVKANMFKQSKSGL
mgnify:CR=1 FL=1